MMPLVRSRVAAPVLRPANINDLALNTTLFYAADLSYTALDIGLSSALFGASVLSPTPTRKSNLLLVCLQAFSPCS